MKHIALTILMCLGAAGFAQEVRFDYDRSANFSAYRTYQWMDKPVAPPGDQLLDQDVKRAVDEQLAGKGLRRVDSGADLQVAYQAVISEERQFDGFGWRGPDWWGNWGDTRVTTSTVEVGTLTVGLLDPATKQPVWRGSATKTVNIKKDRNKNYRNLQKAIAKLFRNYPPPAGKD